MKTFRALSLYVVAVLMVAAVFASPVQWACHHFGWFMEKPWLKFFSRCVTVTAALFLWPLLRSLGMASWEVIGLRARVGLALLRGAAGWVAGFGAMMSLGALAVAAGNRVWSADAWPGLGKPLAVGLTVGVIEEIFFRGLLFGALRREWGAVRAMWVSSIVYAALHFVSEPPKDLLGVAPAFLSLTAFGALLVWCYARSGSLYLPIGLHAGCVAAIKWWGDLTDRGTGGLEWIFGSGRLRLVNGVAALPLVLLVWLALLGFERLMSSIHARHDQKLG